MIDRRNFLKTFLGSMMLINTNPRRLFARDIPPDSHAVTLTQTIHTENHKDRRIFCQIENYKLEFEIERCAADFGCDVHYGEPFSPDLLVAQCFIYILDRNYVGQDYWEWYVGFCDEFNEQEPCLLVDTISDMALPKSNYTAQFNPDDPASITSLLNTIIEVRIYGSIPRKVCDF
jgi:hypothetical protein